jgi:hypothetical protein
VGLKDGWTALLGTCVPARRHACRELSTHARKAQSSGGENGRWFVDSVFSRWDKYLIYYIPQSWRPVNRWAHQELELSAPTFGFFAGRAGSIPKRSSALGTFTFEQTQQENRFRSQSEKAVTAVSGFHDFGTPSTTSSDRMGVPGKKRSNRCLCAAIPNIESRCHCHQKRSPGRVVAEQNSEPAAYGPLQPYHLHSAHIR